MLNDSNVQRSDGFSVSDYLGRPFVSDTVVLSYLQVIIFTSAPSAPVYVSKKSYQTNIVKV
jgi:hypothetical protein